MTKSLNLSLLLLALCMAPAQALAAESSAPWSADIDQVRQAAAMIPGPRPLRVNVIKFAESRRPKNFAVKGLPAEPSVQARTAYQIVYADGTVMVDTGMDPATHGFFGRGIGEPMHLSAARSRSRIFRTRRRGWRMRCEAQERSSSPTNMATISRA